MGITAQRQTVFHLIKLDPKKMGSFEEYIIALANGLKKKNWEVVIAFDGKVPDRLKKRYDGLQIICLSDANGKARFYTDLFKQMRKYKPYIVHLSFYPIFSALTIFIYLICGCNIICSDRVSGIAKERKGLVKTLIAFRNRFIMVFIKKIICVSRYVYERDKFIPGIDCTKLTFFWNGVNLERFRRYPNNTETLHEVGIEKNTFVVASFAHLIKEKGIDYLVKAADIIVQKYKNVMFLLCGTGKEEEQTRALVRGFGLESYFKFLGLRDDLEKVLSATSVFVCPSIWQEAFGFSIAEAQACAVPVIATRVGGIPELIEDGVTGVLVEPRNCRALADAIEYFYKNVDEVRRMGDNARNRAISLFDLERMVADTIRVYENIKS